MKTTLRKICALGAAVFTSLTTQAASVNVTPSTVADDYAGVISLQITGLTNGENVVVEELSDMAGTGNPSAYDITLKAFPVTDGRAIVIGGITNLLVPNDINPTGGAITVQIHTPALGFEQRAVCKRVYRVSSPTGRFTSVTTRFTVTNANYSGQVSGKAQCAGTNVPYASVLLFQMNADGEMEPQMMTTTDSSGNYSVKVTPGNYGMAAFKNGYAVSMNPPTMANIVAGTPATANISLLGTTRKISGRVYDKDNPSRGLGGLLTVAEGDDSKIAVGYTDKDGNFAIGVTAQGWRVGPDDTAPSFLGYMCPDSKVQVSTSGGDMIGMTWPLSPATGFVYGTVANDSGIPQAGASIWAQSWNETSQQGVSMTSRADESGRYFACTVAGNWQMGLDTTRSPGLAQSIVTRGMQGQTLTDSTVVQLNYTTMDAPYVLSGYLKDSTGTPIMDVSMWGEATYNGVNYGTQGKTDGNGNFSMPIASGSWLVAPNCTGNNGLANMGFGCINTNITVSGNTTVNFTAQHCSGVQITTSTLAHGRVNTDYGVSLLADTCGSPASWYLMSGNLPAGMALDSTGWLHGTPTQAGTWSFSVGVNAGASGTNGWLELTVDANDPLSVWTVGLPGATNGMGYTTPLAAGGGTPPYTWGLALGSGPLPPGLNLAANGFISGTPSTSGDYLFRVQVNDNVGGAAQGLLHILVEVAILPLNITTTNLLDGTLGQSFSSFLQAAGGQTPYRWYMGLGSAPLPTGLTLDSNSGEIAGIPTTQGTFYFIANVNDSHVPTGSIDKLVSITIRPGTIPPPSISGPTVGTGGEFQFTVNATPNQTYSMQASTAMQTWTTVATTNTASGSFTFSAPASGSPKAFYRVKVGL